MIFGRSILYFILACLIGACIFFLAQWLLPLVFGLIGIAIPEHIVNILSLLLAIAVVVGGWRGVV